MTSDKTNSRKEKDNEEKEQSSLSIDEEKKKSKKWIQGSAQTFIKWMPLGSSGTWFANAVLNQEWLTALASFPVMVVTVIWASYTESFLQRLAEVFEEKGRQDVDNLMSWQQRARQAFTETIRWQLAGVDDKYLKCQSYTCQDYQIEGLTQSFITQLEEVFVPLAFDVTGEINYRGFLSSSNNNANLSGGEINVIKIWDLLKNGQKNRTYRRLLIKSQGGYGKTTLLRHITYLYTQKRQPRNAPKLLPILLRLRKWQERIYEETSLDLPTLIEKYHLPSLPEGHNFNIPSNWAKNNLKNGKLLILWDGFDEVKPQWRESVSQWLGQQMSHYPNSFFILTSRPGAYNEGYASEHKPQYCSVKPKTSMEKGSERGSRGLVFA